MAARCSPVQPAESAKRSNSASPRAPHAAFAGRQRTREGEPSWLCAKVLGEWIVLEGAEHKPAAVAGMLRQDGVRTRRGICVRCTGVLAKCTREGGVCVNNVYTARPQVKALICEFVGGEMLCWDGILLIMVNFSGGGTWRIQLYAPRTGV